MATTTEKPPTTEELCFRLNPRRGLSDAHRAAISAGKRRFAAQKALGELEVAA